MKGYDISTRLAALLTAFSLIGNDLVVSAHILTHNTFESIQSDGYAGSVIDQVQSETAWQPDSNLVVGSPSEPIEIHSGSSSQPEVEIQLANPIDFEVLDTIGTTLAYPRVLKPGLFIPDHIKNITRNAEAYHLEAAKGSVHHIAIGVDARKLRSINELQQAKVYFLEVETGQWKEASMVRVDNEKLRLEAMVPGETDYFAGLIQAPEMPEASAYVPTSISDLEPANPASGIRVIQPPTVNQMGTANVNYPLWIPQGRAGMAPNVSLVYNSDGSSSWTGFGWDVPVSSISVDSKWGVPVYSNEYESEGYVFNGEKLFEQGGLRIEKAEIGEEGRPLVSPRANNKKYYTKIAQSYRIIERIGDNPSNYCWKITDGAGKTSFYGTYDGAIMNNDLVLRKSNAIAKWYLAKEVDKWGNTILYSTSVQNNFLR
jgi:hypothetical protein